MVDGTDHRAIADILRRLLSDTALRDDLARRAVHHITTNFSYSRRVMLKREKIQQSAVLGSAHVKRFFVTL